jgi:hypothetical protein
MRFRNETLPLLLLACSGCNSYSYSVVVDAGSSGSLLESESVQMARILARDAGAPGEVGPAFQGVTATSLVLSLAGGVGPGGPGCMQIADVPEGNLTISMACPSGIGTFALADLGATACDSSATCADLGGMIETAEYAPQPNDAQGSINATLYLPVVSDGGGPFVSGFANVWVQAVSETGAGGCGGVGGG